MRMDSDLYVKLLLTGWDLFSYGYWSLPQTPRHQLTLNFLLQLRTRHSVSVFWRPSTGIHSTSIHTKFFSWTTFFALCLETTSLMLVQYFQKCVRHEFYLQRKWITLSWVDGCGEACCVFSVRLQHIPFARLE